MLTAKISSVVWTVRSHWRTYSETKPDVLVFITAKTIAPMNAFKRFFSLSDISILPNHINWCVFL